MQAPPSVNMGGTISGTKKIDFDHKEEYMRWVLEDVRAALQRFKDVKKGSPGICVNRLEFRDVFTDYTAIRGGAFLCLPMDHFKVFASEGQLRVIVFEIMSMLALFCNGIEREKVEFLFHMFDFKTQGWLGRSDLVVMLQCITGGLYKVGVTNALPTVEDLEHMAALLLARADANNDQQVSQSEFVEWARLNDTCADVLRSFKLCRRGHMRTTPDDNPSIGLSPNALDSMQTKRKHFGARRPATAISQAFHTPGIKAVGAGYHAKRTRAMKLQTVARRRVLTELSSSTNFTPKELRALAQTFTDMSDVTGRLAFDDFKAVLKTTIPGLMANEQLARRVFSVVTGKGDTVSFKDFVMTLAKCIRGSIDEKLSIVFRLFDKNNDHQLDLVELVGLIKQGNSEVDDIVSFAEEVVEALDKNGDGEVSREEYLSTVEDDPVLFDAFARLITVTPAMHHALHRLKSAWHAFDAVHCAIMFQSLSQQRAQLVQPVTLQSLRKFFAQFFETTSANNPDVDRILVAFQEAVGNGLMLRDIVNAIGQTLAPSRMARAGFFFDLYDTSGNGSLDVSELVHMLLCSKQQDCDAAASVIATLKAIDVDDSGYISMDEFKLRAMREPKVLQAMFRLFNVDAGGLKALLKVTPGSRRCSAPEIDVPTTTTTATPTSKGKRRSKTPKFGRVGTRSNMQTQGRRWSVGMDLAHRRFSMVTGVLPALEKRAVPMVTPVSVTGQQKRVGERGTGAGNGAQAPPAVRRLSAQMPPPVHTTNAIPQISLPSPSQPMHVSSAPGPGRRRGSHLSSATGPARRRSQTSTSAKGRRRSIQIQANPLEVRRRSQVLSAPSPELLANGGQGPCSPAESISQPQWDRRPRTASSSLMPLRQVAKGGVLSPTAVHGTTPQQKGSPAAGRQRRPATAQYMAHGTHGRGQRLRPSTAKEDGINALRRIALAGSTGAPQTFRTRPHTRSRRTVRNGTKMRLGVLNAAPLAASNQGGALRRRHGLPVKQQKLKLSSLESWGPAPFAGSTPS